jgi:UDP-N-acetyl-2-amino-2-deoxyglucuronate dehydrogenase
MANFALLGVGGFVAPRHLGAIRDTGNTLIGACDPHDSVGVMDDYFPDAAFFTEVERFDRFLEKRRREGPERAVQYVSICSPNYLHDAHVRLALRLNAHALCEKPLVINPWNLDQLQALEREYDTRVRTVLQLRYVPALARLRQQFMETPPSTKKDVVLSYITRRGRWYHHSWKGSEAKSGGLAMNIGIHLFDLMIWLFGPVSELEIHAREPKRVSGMMELEHANVRWFLSIEESDLPEQVRREAGHAWRSLLMDGEAIEFSNSFQDLHTEVYRETLAGRGHGIDDARASIELAYRVRTQPVVPPRDSVHPKLRIA